MPAAPIQNPSRGRVTCPTCGAQAERGQLVCLECGGRVSLAYRRPPSWKFPAAITALVLLLAVLVGVLAFQAIDDEARREVSATPAKPNPAAAEGAGPRTTPTGGEGGPSAEAGSGAEADREGGETEDPPGGSEPTLGSDSDAGEEPATDADDGPATDAGGLVKEGDLYKWPSGLRGFTVVLLSNEDRASATRFARSAAGPADRIGVISSSDFRTLPQGFFVVFAGRYASRAEADEAAGRLAGRFPGAFPQLVRP